MPLKQIEVVSSGKKTSEMERKPVSTEEMKVDEVKGVVKVDIDKSAVTDSSTDSNCCECDENAQNDTVGEVSVDLDCDVMAPHVEADTVIIGDSNSEKLSNDTSRPVETTQDTQCCRQSESDPPSNVTSDISVTSNTTTTDKRTNSRTPGKTGKKEKPTPVRKKDGETQVFMLVSFLHCNIAEKGSYFVVPFLVESE